LQPIQVDHDFDNINNLNREYTKYALSKPTIICGTIDAFFGLIIVIFQTYYLYIMASKN